MSALTAIDLYVNPNALLPALQGALDASGYFGVVSIDVYPGNPVPGPGPSFPAGIVVINITITQTNAQSIKLHYQDCQTNTPLDVIDCCINESDSTLIHDNLDIDYTDLYYQEIEYTGLDINRIEIGGDCSIGLLRNDYFYDADHRITHMKSTLFNPDPIPDVYNTTYTYSPAGNILSLRRKGFVGLDGNDDPIFAQIDKLLYTYHQDIPSKLIKVEDSDQLTHQPKGFFPLVSEYDYDANGNLVEDSGKDLEIDYNLLNLPTYIFNTDTHDEMLFEYAFGGEKLKKVSIIDDTTRTRLYMGGFEFLDDEPEAFHHAEGRIVLTDSLPRFQFKIADHLGNTVVLFEDKDNSGTISTVIPQDPEDAEVVQRNLYYPFGMQLEGTWKHLTDPQMNYTYNNKEWENDLGLEWLFFGARCLDPATGRFISIDRFADHFAFQSPYTMAANNPVIFMDVNGDSVAYANASIEGYVDRYASETITNKKGKVKTNPNYNADFAANINRLKESTDWFVFSDDPSKMQGTDPKLLGEFNLENDGSQFNIVVPNFISGDKGKLTDLNGGRGSVLAEEVFHATQYLDGNLQKIQNIGGGFGLKAVNNTTRIMLEVEAKIFVANSGMANLSTSNYLSGYTVPTWMGLIKKENGNGQAVGHLLINGATRTVYPTFGGGSPTTVLYHPSSYSIY